MATRLRSGKAAKTVNGNHSNNANTSTSQLGNGDLEPIYDDDDEEIDELLLADDYDDDLVSENQSENGQGDAKPIDQSCSTCFRTVLRYIMWCIINITVFIIIFLLVLSPLIIKLFPEIPKHIVYLNAFKIPYDVNLSDPASVELNYARNFYQHVEENITIGVWHILPKSLEQEGLKSEDFDSLLSSEYPIILYCHGNTGTRGTDHRVDMYKVLAALNFHVIALDYRGYGDSTGSPTSENGVMTDVVTLYLWLREKAGPDVPIYVWGHSLGSGIATKAVRFLTEQRSEHPRGLMLESPFNNILDAAMEHPFSKLFRLLWWFDDVFLEAMHTYGIYLQSDDHICHIEVPVLILHAEDDYVIPVELGMRLYEASKKRPKSFPPVTFHVFPYERGFLHKYIYTAEELPDIIHKFIKESKQT